MKMNRRTALLATAVAASGAISVLSHTDDAFAGPNAREIMDKWAESRKLDGSEAVVKMSIIDEKGNAREREISMATKLFDGGATEKRIYRFLAPADVKGTGVLVFDYADAADDIWIFLPALRKSRRVVSSQRSKSFMGSEFSYGDLNIPRLDDYTYKTLKEESVKGAACWVVEVLPKDNDIAKSEDYSKKLYWIEKSNYAVRKGEFFDLKGKLMKELVSDNVKLVDSKNKRYRAMHMEMINKQNGRRSVFATTKVAYAPETQNSYFTTAYLERP
jgi:hypothetical protein